MPRQSQRVAKCNDNNIATQNRSLSPTVQMDYSGYNVFELLSMIMAKNTDPEINCMLQATVAKLPELIKDIARETAKETARETAKEVVRDADREHCLVFSGVPEAPANLLPSERQLDLDVKIGKIFDILDIESRPVANYRMGKFLPTRPRLVKVVLHSRSHFLTALRNARRLLTTEFKGVYVRQSMTYDERRHDFELRQEAKKRNGEANERIWAVYRGELVKIDTIKNNRNSGN
ncbi:unnamed protein product [Nippostrongylus brasiliensis]|uniref:Uncharacterized protein n=1 Tax=Nippostrongylus brasiliensis TaxID=27835 RepID=A0A0N4YK86_NIPBR|nr:unnamed protein product [Nippostrongylus brasiliensis]